MIVVMTWNEWCKKWSQHNGSTKCDDVMIVIMTWNERCKKWSQHNGGTKCDDVMIVIMTWNEGCKKWSQHNGGTKCDDRDNDLEWTVQEVITAQWRYQLASAGVTEANHNNLSQGSRWPSQDSNQASLDYKSEASLLQPTWLAALQGQTVSNILFYAAHPIVFQEVKYKQTGHQLLSNTKIYFVFYTYFNVDMLLSFAPSSGHLTQI